MGTKYKSRFEATFAKLLRSRKVKFTYETVQIPYTLAHNYKPDWCIPQGKKVLFIETKGRLTVYDRAKHLAIKKQHPELDIRFVFENSNKKLYKGAKSSYGDWATKHGFLWSNKGELPKTWIMKNA